MPNLQFCRTHFILSRKKPPIWLLFYLLTDQGLFAFTKSTTVVWNSTDDEKFGMLYGNHIYIVRCIDKTKENNKSFS